MNKQRILVLGCGFLGTNLIKFYSQNPDYEVFASLYKNEPWEKEDNVTYYTVDLTQEEQVEYLFEQTKPDIVLQFAAYTTNSKDVIERPQSHATRNYVINSLVLDAAHRHNVKNFVYPSCGTMYESKETPQTEKEWSLDTIPACYKHVAFMKTAVERMCEAYSDMGKCKYTVIRQSNVFGKFDKTDLSQAHLLMATIMKVFKATDELEIWGSETNQAKRDLIYVDDVVDLVNRAIQLQKTPYEIFNCGAGKAYSVSEIVKIVQKVSNKEYLSLKYNNKLNIPTILSLDFTKAYEELGWYPKTNLEDGIKKTLEWYKLNFV